MARFREISDNMRAAPYAIIWLIAMAVVVAGNLEWLCESLPEWTAYTILVAFCGVNLLVAIRRPAWFKWPVIVGLVLMFMPTTGLFFGVIGAVGIGKLVVYTVGRRSMFANSRMQVKRAKVSPRSMIR